MALNVGGKLIFAFVTLLLGIILVAQLATMEQPYVTHASVSNEAISVAAAKFTGNQIWENVSFNVAKKYTGNNGWKTEYSDCNMVAIGFDNGSTSFTKDTDYNLTSNGILTLKNTSATQGSIPNATYLDYTYCPDDYMATSWGRSALNVTMGMFALGCFILSVGLFWSVAKEQGFF